MRLIACGLDRARFEPIVVLPDAGPLADDLTAEGVETLIHPVAVIRRELASGAGAVELISAAGRDAAWLGRLIRRRRVALVHSNTSVILGGGAAAAATRVPHVWHVREIYSRFGRLWPAWRSVLVRGRAVVCVSEATAAPFSRHRERVHVVPDGLALVPRRGERAAARAALGLPREPPAVAVLGRISDWKGQDVLVRALAEPALRERGAIGLLAGEPWPGAPERLDSVLALARQLGVAERLHLLGFRDEVSTVLGAADVVAVPSTEPDPLPGAAIEAAAAGCPVVASAHGGLPEIIREGVTGRLVAPGDAGALARAVAELLDDPAAAGRLGAAASQEIPRRFAPERMVAAIEQIYASVLRGAD